MGFGARLAKLEEKAARVIRCAWCRVSLIDDHQQKARGRTVTTDYIMRSCPFCGGEFKVGLESLTPKERESFMLWAYTYSGKTYRDARAYAAQEWWTYRAWVRIFTEPEHRRAVAARQQRPDKPDSYARERAELKAEADRLRKAEVRRQRRVYGPRTFPLVATLRGLKEGLKDLERLPYSQGYVHYPAKEKIARQVLIYARCMEACELVVWGAVDETTAARIEASAAGVTAFDKARAEEAAEKERAAVERERLANEQREARERERSAREGWAAPVRTPEPVVPRLRFRIDPTAAHVPDASGEQGSGPLPGFIAPSAPEPARMVRFPGDYDPNHPDAVKFQRSAPPEELPDYQKYYRGEYWDGDPRY
jgi:hypothetical protein